MGYDAMVCKGTNDDGVDVYARRSDEYILIQCKHWRSTSVGKTIVQAIKAKAAEEETPHAAVVTSGKFEPGAVKWARRNDVDIIDGDRFIELIIAHYMDAYRQPVNVDGSTQPVHSTTSAHENTVDSNDDVPLSTTTLFPVDGPTIEDTIIELVRSKGSVVNSDIRNALGVDTSKATAILRDMCTSGQLIMVGIKRGARYFDAQSYDNENPDLMAATDEVRGDTHAHSDMISTINGVVHFYNHDRRFGKVAVTDDAIDLYFFHASHLDDPLDELFISQGVSVQFIPKTTERGLQANEVRLVLSSDDKMHQSTFRTGTINYKGDFYAFVTDKLSSLSLYLPRSILDVETWDGLNVESVIQYDVAPSPNPDHNDKWEITSIYSDSR